MRGALLLIFFGVVTAQTPPIPTSSQDLQTVIEATQSLDPAFAADLKLQIAATTVFPPGKRAELISQAFEIAALVKEPLPMTLGVVTRPAESIYDTQTAAYRLGLDRLSLQTRAVNAAMAYNPADAMKLWTRIQMPSLTRAACRDALVIDLFDYYDATLRATRGDATTAVLEGAIAEMKHPAQVGPLARLLVNIKVHSVDFSLLILRFATAMDQIESDDRDFVSSIVGRNDLLGQVLALANRAEAAGESSLPLLTATRRYLLRHLNGHRCGESEVMPNQAGSTLIKRFNDVFASKFRRDSSFQRIEYTELASSDTEPGVTYLPFWQTPTSQQLQSTPFAVSKPSAYLAAWYKWEPGEEASPADYFHEKCLTMFDAIQAVRPGPDRESLISAYLQYLSGAYLAQEKREWFLHFERLATQIYAERGSDRKAWRVRLITTGDPVMSAYGRLLYWTGTLTRN